MASRTYVAVLPGKFQLPSFRPVVTLSCRYLKDSRTTVGSGTLNFQLFKATHIWNNSCAKSNPDVRSRQTLLRGWVDGSRNAGQGRRTQATTNRRSGTSHTGSVSATGIVGSRGRSSGLPSLHWRDGAEGMNSRKPAGQGRSGRCMEMDTAGPHTEPERNAHCSIEKATRRRRICFFSPAFPTGRSRRAGDEAGREEAFWGASESS